MVVAAVGYNIAAVSVVGHIAVAVGCHIAEAALVGIRHLVDRRDIAERAHHSHRAIDCNNCFGLAYRNRFGAVAVVAVGVARIAAIRIDVAAVVASGGIHRHLRHADKRHGHNHTVLLQRARLVGNNRHSLVAVNYDSVHAYIWE